MKERIQYISYANHQDRCMNHEPHGPDFVDKIYPGVPQVRVTTYDYKNFIAQCDYCEKFIRFTDVDTMLLKDFKKIGEIIQSQYAKETGAIFACKCCVDSEIKIENVGG